MTVAGDENIIFDANTAPTGDVDTRFNCGDHPGFQNGGACCGKAWQLVDIEADAVPQAMAEIAAETSVCNHPSGDPVDFLARYSRLDGVDRLELRT